MPAPQPIASRPPPQSLRYGHQDALDLIAELRLALRRAKRTGGTYPVFVRDATGSVALTIEIAVSLEAKP